MSSATSTACREVAGVSSRATVSGCRRVQVSSEAGVILFTVLLVAALLAVLSAIALRLLGDEFWEMGRRRAALQARYNAEAAVHHAAALLAPDRALAVQPLAGALSHPEAPGPWLDFGGGLVAFPGAPFGYDAHLLASPASAGSGSVAAGDSPQTAFLRVLGRGWSVAATRRAVEGVLGLAPLPYLPAALVVTSGEVSFSPGALELFPELPAREIAAAGFAELDRLLPAFGWEGLAAEERGALVRSFNIHSFAAGTGLERIDPVGQADFELAGTAIRLGGGRVGHVRGSGVVFVEGDLVIGQDFDLEGAIYGSGTIRFEGAHCRARGLVWARRIELAPGVRCRFEAALAALVSAESAVGLPRAIVVRGVSDTEMPGDGIGQDPVAFRREVFPARVERLLAGGKGGQRVYHDQLARLGDAGRVGRLG